MANDVRSVVAKVFSKEFIYESSVFSGGVIGFELSCLWR